ncbi:hypothetical protein Pla175_17220 [Pirellulimonas nuda]|uniref:Peptidase family M50 n=1 Tax=Pirellulimonas nuda TaxID=2528009 RepID=A0A518DA36_9BACT|nr:M50 family metallopeptidase [Pirellulimonas nuda]QDU88347.1 hypothetical protein Pla175_17220 [Pirellulimonas nuda]
MRRLLLAVPAAAWCWLAMMFVHELGHVVAGWLTGGRIAHVELRPGRLSHTLVLPNPWPTAVVWSGIIVGWLTPQIALALRPICWMRIGLVAEFWAGFCLLAGGVYLAVGGGTPLTDTEQLVALGWPLPMLIAIGAAVAVIGYVRARSASVRFYKDIRDRDVGLDEVAFWWWWLVAWCVGQSIVASLVC